MLKRLLPTLVGLGLALAALAWGLVSLERIFVQERDDARNALALRRNALEQYAHAALRDLLHRQLAAALKPMNAALADASDPGPDLLFVERGIVRLPRTGSAPEPLPALAGATLLAGGRWYAEPQDELIRGMKIELAPALAQVTEVMRIRLLLTPQDHVELPALPDAPFAATLLAPAIVSPHWLRHEETLAQRFRLKTGLVLLCGLFALVIAGLAVVGQARKTRFLELKSHFVAAVSHELRTPLASIRLLAETLERRLEGHPEARDYPARIVSDADELQVLVENILSFNRLEKGRWRPQLAEVSLEELAGSVRAQLAGRTPPVELRLEGLEGLTLRADEELLRLLFANLARNACSYNERNPVRIVITGRRERGLTVTFEDNGVGIPASEQARVFEEFERGPTLASAPRGSGLGLALCRRIMELHGGRIRIARSSSDGTTFALEFPR